MLTFETRPFLVAEEASDTHAIGGDDRDPDPAGKPIGTKGPDPLQAVVLQPVDRGLDRRMLLPGGGKFGGLFARPFYRRRASFLWQRHEVQRRG